MGKRKTRIVGNYDNKILDLYQADIKHSFELQKITNYQSSIEASIQELDVKHAILLAGVLEQINTLVSFISSHEAILGSLLKRVHRIEHRGKPE